MGGLLNVCGSCRLDFSSLRAFDGHRVGRHGYTGCEGLRMDPPRDDGRRCLVEWELRAAGFVQDVRGRWGVLEHQVRARERFVRDPGLLEAA